MEQDSVALYDALAGYEKDERRAQAFRGIAATERRHAGIWAERLRSLGADVPAPRLPRARIRFVIVVARLFGTRAVADLVLGLEGDEERTYQARAELPEAQAIAADEREHAEIWRRLGREGTPGGDAAARQAQAGVVLPAPLPTSAFPAAPLPAATVETTRRTRFVNPVADIANVERWHRGGAGTLRAIVFGASDGLVSNLSLVMGVAGATADPGFILLSGIAGLLAGAFSMAAGEYVSVQSQVEILRRQIALERAELATLPEEEKEELVSIYRAKGLPEEDARRVAEHIFADPEMALETLVREELGLDPHELGSPWAAAGGSFLAFTIGAIIPVIPYVPILYGGAGVSIALSFGLSLGALFVVGALVSLLTGRSLFFSGVRQVAIGAAAALVTYGVGRLIGVSTAG
jgi:VIT1/CCC1 family predicted Fe2+/Mn2+ transporter